MSASRRACDPVSGRSGPQNPVGPSGLIAGAFVLVGMIYDWRTRGRPHSAYVIGGLMLVVVQVVRVPISTAQIRIRG